jgi:predicted 3-demethylubiquinone-9 3-methyltransferase (glyoxalase superfamily)
MQKITPFLWFDRQAEEAAKFYTSIFPNSRIIRVTRYGKEGFEIHKMEEGTAMTIEFELDGQPFTALNGGPAFNFSEAVSFQAFCKDQKDIDHYWDNLSAGGPEAAQQCGWLKDKYGLSWQIVPFVLGELMNAADPLKSQCVTRAMLKMKKLDIAALQQAYDQG